MRRLLMVLALIGGVRTSAQELPAGTGRDEVLRRCVVCHESDLIAQQRLPAAAWTRELDKMIRWGAAVEGPERDPIVAYLASHFSPVRTSGQGPSTAGAVTFTRACQVCHEADLVEAQRLSHSVWTREVDKMIRWGAVVADSEKAALVDYLAGRFPAR